MYACMYVYTYIYRERERYKALKVMYLNVGSHDGALLGGHGPAVLDAEVFLERVYVREPAAIHCANHLGSAHRPVARGPDAPDSRVKQSEAE